MSRFDLDWLQERSFLTEDQNEYLDQNYIKPQLWSKDQFLLKEFRAADVLESDEGMKEFKVQYDVILRCMYIVKRASFWTVRCERKYFI